VTDQTDEIVYPTTRGPMTREPRLESRDPVEIRGALTKKEMRYQIWGSISPLGFFFGAAAPPSGWVCSPNRPPPRHSHLSRALSVLGCAVGKNRAGPLFGGACLGLEGWGKERKKRPAGVESIFTPPLVKGFPLRCWSLPSCLSFPPAASAALRSAAQHSTAPATS